MRNALNPRDKIPPAIDSTAKGASVARRRFLRGSVFLNKARTAWLGAYAEYVLASDGSERRLRKQIILSPIRRANGESVGKRDAQRLLQPYVDRVNASISVPSRMYKSITFEAFTQIWERDYLSLYKPSTQATMRGQLKRLRQHFGVRDMRDIGPADLQRLIAIMEAEGYEPKTIRNLWATIRLIWDAARAQGYVVSIPPKPKLPRLSGKRPRYFRLEDVAKIIAYSQGEYRVFYWLAAETGLRAGELCALTLADVSPASVAVNQSVWNGKVDTPKTPNAVRTLAVSPQLSALLSGVVRNQQTKGHSFLFTTRTGRPWDTNLLRKKKLSSMLQALQIPQAGLHAFRHFNASLLNSLRVPLKTIQERLGHAMTGSLTLDVYTHAEFNDNVKAAAAVGEAIEKAVNSVSLSAIQQKELDGGGQQALSNQLESGCGGWI